MVNALQRSLQHRLGELLQQPIDVLGRAALFQQIVNQLVTDRFFLLLSFHLRSPYFAGERLHSFQDTLAPKEKSIPY
jgi:hypothetical protein